MPIHTEGWVPELPLIFAEGVADKLGQLCSLHGRPQRLVGDIVTAMDIAAPHKSFRRERRLLLELVLAITVVVAHFVMA